jgi:hypothetical protein
LWDQPGLLLGLGRDIFLPLLRKKGLLLCRLLLGKWLAHPFLLLCL